MPVYDPSAESHFHETRTDGSNAGGEELKLGPVFSNLRFEKMNPDRSGFTRAVIL